MLGHECYYLNIIRCVLTTGLGHVSKNRGAPKLETSFEYLGFTTIPQLCERNIIMFRIFSLWSNVLPR